MLDVPDSDMDYRRLVSRRSSFQFLLSELSSCDPQGDSGKGSGLATEEALYKPIKAELSCSKVERKSDSGSGGESPTADYTPPQSPISHSPSFINSARLPPSALPTIEMPIQSRTNFAKLRTEKSAGKKISKRQRVVPVDCIAKYVSPGILPLDHKPARGRGRAAQLKKMSREQIEAEADARAEKNRQAAKKCRQIRKAETEHLRNKCAELESINMQSNNFIKKLHDEYLAQQHLIECMKNELKNLRRQTRIQ